MSFSTGTSSQQSDMNVTPLIDVLLVLLIIFMIITPTTPHGLNSQIPQGKPQPTDVAPPPPVLVELTGTPDAPTYRINRSSVEASAFHDTLTAALQSRQERVVFVRAARDLTFQPVAHLVALVKASGATTIALDDPTHPLL